MYKIFGLNVLSEYPIKEALLIEENEIDPDVYISSIPYDETVMSIDTEIVDVKNRLAYEKLKLSHFDEKESIIHIVGYSYYKIKEGNRIEYCVYGDDEATSQTILCLCFPTLLLQRNFILLHGSGILYKDRVLMISGESGSGKSSLAHEMMRRWKKQLTDDIIGMNEENDRFMVIPSFPMRKLCEDQVERSEMDKKSLFRIPDEGREKYGLILREEYCQHPVQAGYLVIIEPAEMADVMIKEIKGTSKLQYLTRNLFREDYFEQIKLKPDQLKALIRLANQLPIYVLYRPIGKMTVVEQADLIEQTF